MSQSIVEKFFKPSRFLKLVRNVSNIKDTLRYSKGACTNWIRPTDTGWKTFAETYPEYFYLPETKYGEGGWIGGYRSSAWQIVKWWHDSASIIIIR